MISKELKKDYAEDRELWRNKISLEVKDKFSVLENSSVKNGRLKAMIDKIPFVLSVCFLFYGVTLHYFSISTTNVMTYGTRTFNAEFTSALQ